MTTDSMLDQSPQPLYDYKFHVQTGPARAVMTTDSMFPESSNRLMTTDSMLIPAFMTTDSMLGKRSQGLMTTDSMLTKARYRSHDYKFHVGSGYCMPHDYKFNAHPAFSIAYVYRFHVKGACLVDLMTTDSMSYGSR